MVRSRRIERFVSALCANSRRLPREQSLVGPDPRPRNHRRRRVLAYSIILPLVYGAWLTGCAFFQDRFIYPRDLAGPGRRIGDLPRGVESIWIDAGSPDRPLKIEAWYLPPPAEAGAASTGKHPAVIFFHGNAELIDTAIEHVRPWRDRGYAVLLPEYRGYGRSGGSPSQSAIVADAIRFHDLLAV